MIIIILKFCRQKRRPCHDEPSRQHHCARVHAQKGLSRCLESICSQTYQELEIIVLNDGSTDDSLAICEQFRAKDPRIVVVDKENEGVSRTRNAGLTLAQGDYIQFADSDDALDLITPEPCTGRLAAQRRPCDRSVLDGDPLQLQQDRARAGNAADLPCIEPEAPKTEVHKYGFLPQGVTAGRTTPAA